MAQKARPIATTTIGAWTDQAGGTTDIHLTLDETSASDSDYVRSEQTPSFSPFVVKLTSLTDPVSSTGHVVRWRSNRDLTGGDATLTVQLRQGYVSEGSLGTLIASLGPTSQNVAFTDGSFTLSAGQADSITDYTNLYLRFAAAQVS